MKKNKKKQETTEQTTYYCRRCGRKLKNPEAIALGFGNVCYKKFLNQPKLTPLFIMKVSKKIIEK